MRCGKWLVLSLTLVTVWAWALADGSAQLPGQPYTSYWHPNDLLSWSPATDPDADFNRSHVPLSDRFTNPDVHVNPNARWGEGEIAALSIMYPSTSGSPSQGADVFDVYAFNYWQYIDLLVMWGGSASEGLILSPSADVIDAGHRNGVKVYGTIFFPPQVYGGQIQWVRDLVQRDGDVFPVADKLIEVTEYYGFDGWFINQETEGGDSTLANEMRDFMKYVQTNSDVRLMWYDAMNETGAVGWQQALNSLNDMFFEDDGVVSQEMFLDFAWNGAKIASSHAHAESLGRDPYDVHAGINVQSQGWKKYVNWQFLFPSGEPHVLSVGFYCPNWCYTTALTHEEFYQNANRFWVGANRDPSYTETTHHWKGMAHYIAAWSPITDVPFVTSFNTGQGHLYAIEGQVLRTTDWHNRSLQDVLPTWRWIAESAGTALYPELDWSEAYYGGTCLKVSGDLDPTNTTHLKLFMADLPIASGDELRVVYKLGAASEPTYMKAGLAFADDPTVYEFFDVGSTVTSGWDTAEFDLSAYAGRTIAVISLLFEAAEPETSYSIKIGQVGVIEGSGSPPAPPTGLYVDGFQLIDSDHGTVRLKWAHSPGDVYSYYTYRVNPGGSLTFLGGTPNNAYFVSALERIGGEAQTSIVVEAVGPDFNHSVMDTTIVDWSSLTEVGAHPADDTAGHPSFSRTSPNPFYSATKIQYRMPTAGTRVTLTLHDVRGRLVRTLVDDEMSSGLREVVWDGTTDEGERLPSGLYLARLSSRRGDDYRKILLIR